MLDYDQKIDIDIQTEIIDISTLQSTYKDTSRMLLKFIVVGKYKIDADINIYLYYKQFNDDTQFGLNYIISKDEERFKQRLPAGINVREYYIRIIGTGLTEADIDMFGVLWIPRRIGNR